MNKMTNEVTRVTSMTGMTKTTGVTEKNEVIIKDD